MKTPLCRDVSATPADHSFRRAGEFYAPLPLAALALLVVNDTWLKPAFHSVITGKLSDVAICFLLPLFVSELLGLSLNLRPRPRLALGAILTSLLFAALEVVPSFTRFALRLLTSLGPHLGISQRFQMTSDWTDLFCLLFVPLAVAYGERRLSGGSSLRGEAMDHTDRLLKGLPGKRGMLDAVPRRAVPRRAVP